MLWAMVLRLNPTVGLWTAAVAGLAALLGIVAVVNPALALFGTFGVVFVALSMVNLTIGVVFFTLLVGVIEVIPGLGEVSAAKLAAGVLVIAWAGSMVTGDAHRRQLLTSAPAVSIAAALLIVWAAVSGLWAESSGRAQSDTIRLALNMLLVPIVFAALHDNRDLRRLIAAFVGGVLFSAVYGFIVAPDDLQSLGRLGGAGIDPNYLAVWLVASAALAGALAADRELGPLGRALALLAAVMAVAMMLQTASRTGVVALAVVALAGLAFAGRGRRVPLLVLVVIAVGAGTLYFNGVATENARARLVNADDGSGRTSIWAVGWRMVEANSVRGVGMGNFQVSSVHYLLEPGAIERDEFIVSEPKQAHNVYLEVLAELGMIGLTLFIGLVALCLGSAVRAARIFQRVADRSSEMLARGTLFAMVAVLAGCFFVSLQYTKPVWLLLALGPVLLTRARRAEHGAP
jgi:O-antigen ligase